MLLTQEVKGILQQTKHAALYVLTEYMTSSR